MIADTDYQEFLASKHKKAKLSGFDVASKDINQKLYLYQRDIVKWALRLGKAAIFADCGLGKTYMQLEWAKHVVQHTGSKVLILAPLGVNAQTIEMAKFIDVDIMYVGDDEDIDNADDKYRIFITNYDRIYKRKKDKKIVSRFDCSRFGGVILDESSILKSFSSAIRNAIIEYFNGTPYKLACTATPSPNDTMELANHAEFLDVMDRNLFLSTFFVHDSGKTADWRLKSHATDAFWDFVTSWAVSISRPGDLGEKYEMPGYDLPKLNIIKRDLPASDVAHQKAYEQGMLFPVEAVGLKDTRNAKKDSLVDRVKETKQIVLGLPADTPILIWCEFNNEADALKAALPDAVEVNGSQKKEVKEEYLLGFATGKYRILITKTQIAGFGLNYQHCNKMIFMSGTFSFEKTYQGIRRCWRFGQENEVDVYNIFSVTEGNVQSTLARKQKQFAQMQKEMNAAMSRGGLFRNDKRLELVKVDQQLEQGQDWQIYLGDCVEMIKNVEDNSIGHSIYSPPFSELFVYSNAEADMGNCSGDDEFFEHYRYLIREMKRVTMPGRVTAVHCSDLPSFKWRDGYIGIRDFSGKIIEAHEAEGWRYHTRITIWKDPVLEMQRTKANGLLHKQFKKNSAACRVGIPDYLLIFRKWDDIDDGVPVPQNRVHGDYIGDNPPALNPDTEYSIDLWQRYASPVWDDIRQSHVLNKRLAKDEKDEKHICPLQLDAIARSIDWFSNEGDTILSPFAGIGSEGYEAIKAGRKFIGIELKPKYHEIAVKNLKEAERIANQVDLFSFAGVDVDGE